ncbi:MULTISPECIES: ABC transporter permease [Vibrio]|uniref:ABC transporter permease n=2 Tax=Vibrio TaxID=662 RepID=A0A7X4LNS8_9VIBR|nr:MULTISPECIES: ABC transporter permease [Vibrio]MBF9000746.1 ABC transporter permease [Vibrio nitrifigilis]MZI95186.1 ABC transporter permease [Vibrio eleionomae]
MNNAIDISWWQLALFGLILSIPLAINAYHQLGLAKDIVISIGRMAIQLFLVGSYLQYLFNLNNLWINIAWMLCMITVGASSILSKTHLPKRLLLLPITLALGIGMFPTLAIICLTMVQPTPLYSAQYMIPLAGMLLGNTISSNIIALQNLFSCYQRRKGEYEAAIALGAAPTYASRSFVREALQKASAPLLASMATIGLVTLPGMMTGQILGGASPMIAIKYQLMIMTGIYVTMNVSLVCTVHLSLRKVLTREGRILVELTKLNK